MDAIIQKEVYFNLRLCIWYNFFMNDSSNSPRELRLRPDIVENLQLFSEMLKKPPEKIVEEALESYFDAMQKQMLEKNMMDENAQTNLSYDEFWDGVDL